MIDAHTDALSNIGIITAFDTANYPLVQRYLSWKYLNNAAFYY